MTPPVRLCTGFPPSWPSSFVDAISAGFRDRWPVEFVADRLSAGGDLNRHRLIIPAAAADDLPDGALLAWIDPDIETLSSVPAFVIPQLLADADLGLMIRNDGSLDLSFWIARLSPGVRSFLVYIAMFGGIEPGPGAAWAKALDGSLKIRDLTPGRHSDDAWQLGPLGRYTRRAPRPE